MGTLPYLNMCILTMEGQGTAWQIGQAKLGQGQGQERKRGQTLGAEEETGKRTEAQARQRHVGCPIFHEVFESTSSTPASRSLSHLSITYQFSE